MKIRKTNLECVLESIVSLLASYFIMQIGCAGRAAAPGSEGARRWRRPQGREWVAHTWRCLPCVRPEAGRRGSHTSQKGALYAPPDALAKPLRMRQTISKFAKRTWNVSWNQQLHFWRLTSPCRLGAQGMVAASGSEGVRRRRRPQGREWVAHTWRCLPCVRQRGRLVDSRTHRRRRDVCATQRLALGEGAG